MNQSLIILGSRGMLGQMVKKYFAGEGFDITCFDQRFEIGKRLEYADYLKSLRSGCVINCIGKIKQKSEDANELLFVNTILPSELRNVLHEDIVLIQPGTDCVFNGKRGSPYPGSHGSDAEDEYGWSKRLGEVVLEGRPNTLIPRVSIIGPDNNAGGKGLFAWVKSNPPGSKIKGFTNHLWNGITTLEWCRQVHQFMKQNRQFPFRLIQFGTAAHYSKYEMLLLFNRIFNLDLFIEAVETPGPIDRRLVPDIICKPLPEQLRDLKSF
ncbi:MAG: sugar nucleotide-binding protein [Bacteroidota bacterium]|nr:sugar nucleotide-binding protein [Bacteroidota bacterium]